ncbi:conserved hypothetical protein [Neorickettsia risticii str. Illinois]|uniref:Macro domain-containing protein n=1 Tax=Neorickettsia risticii (strain Illinois) TaxID=434131 RepID=C6V3Y6_NEORI|nr:hypothetical protein [Neorickettsia risticii]ACT69106.1 conserved hypothetical protein [Neorickettsia risticii str. Illinois]
MREDIKITLIVCGVAVLLLGLAALLYWLCKMHAARKAALEGVQDEEELPPVDESPLPPRAESPLPPRAESPLFRLEDTELGPRNIPVSGMESCVLSPEGILNSEGEPNWSGNVILVDFTEGPFREGRYTGEEASNALYRALGIFGDPVSDGVRGYLSAGGSAFDSGMICEGPGWRACVVHLERGVFFGRITDDPPEDDVQEACLWALRRVCMSVLSSKPGDFDSFTLLIPFLGPEIYPGNVSQSAAIGAFANGFRIAFCGQFRALLLSRGIQVVVCCGDRETQLALAEAMDKVRQKMDQEAGKTPDSPAR